MITKKSAGLYPWSKDLEASTDVLLPGFAVLRRGRLLEVAL
jgi:hypothetical protein